MVVHLYTLFPIVEYKQTLNWKLNMKLLIAFRNIVCLSVSDLERRTTILTFFFTSSVNNDPRQRTEVEPFLDFRDSVFCRSLTDVYQVVMEVMFPKLYPKFQIVRFCCRPFLKTYLKGFSREG